MMDDKRRIDACLRACAGISTQNLEDNAPIIELARQYNVVLRERDELRSTVRHEVDCVEAAMVEIKSLRSEIETVKKVATDLLDENEVLRKALAQKVTSETMLRDLNVGNGSFAATFEGGAVHLLVDSLATQFVESGAPNYIEMRFHSEETGPLLLTLQRVDGATPHELRVKAENERDVLRNLLSETISAPS